MRWSTLAKLAWDAMQPPDPESLVERAKRGWRVVQDAGDAAELANEVLKLSDDDEGEKRC